MSSMYQWRSLDATCRTVGYILQPFDIRLIERQHYVDYNNYRLYCGWWLLWGSSHLDLRFCELRSDWRSDLWGSLHLDLRFCKLRVNWRSNFCEVHYTWIWGFVSFVVIEDRTFVRFITHSDWCMRFWRLHGNWRSDFCEVYYTWIWGFLSFMVIGDQIFVRFTTLGFTVL